MAVSLKKGQKVSLTKDNEGLSELTVGLGWDAAAKKKGLFSFGSTPNIDCDASAVLLNNGKFVNVKDVVYFGNLKHSSGAVRHLGDNLTGDGDGDDEQIKIDLSAMPANLTKVAFTVTIHEAEQRRQNFGQVANSYIRIYNEETGEEILRYDLGEDFSIETAAVFGELYKHGNEWKFNAVGQGTQDTSVTDLAKRFM